MFEKLLRELDAESEKLAKAMPVGDGKGDDANIKVAADDPRNEGAEAGDDSAKVGDDADRDVPDDDDEEEGEGEEADEDEMLGKSFEVTVDGKRMRAFDGAHVVRKIVSRLADHEKDMSKALGVSLDLVRKMSVRMDSMQKALDEANKTISEIANSGRGRKSVGSDLSKAHDKGGIAPAEFMAKALEVQKAGRLTGFDISLAESCLNRGAQIPERILKAVANAE